MEDAGEPSSEERLREWMGEVEAAKTRVEQDAGEPSSEERLRERLAELEATKARVEREAERASQQTRADLIAKVFPVLDSLDRALVTPSDASALAEGVKMVRDQLAEVLSDFGVSRIESVGRRFDPTEHEAMDVLPVENPADDGKVVEQWQAGFRLGQKVLRPARVRVGKSLPTHQ